MIAPISRPTRIFFPILILLAVAFAGSAQQLLTTVTDAQLQQVVNSVAPEGRLVQAGQFQFVIEKDIRITILNKGSSLVLGAQIPPTRPVDLDQLHALHRSLRYVRLVQNKDGSIVLLADHVTNGGVTEANLKAWLEIMLGQVKVVRDTLSKE